MLSRPQKKSPIERRLKELERQAARVRNDIKSLSKAIRNPENVERIPRAKSLLDEGPLVPAPSRRDPATRAVPPHVVPPVEQAAAAAPPPPPEPPPPPPAAMAPPAQPEPAEAAAPKPKGVLKDERFANYFSSGSFLGETGGLKQEKSVQRNKAVFMIIIVIIVAFSVYQLVFR